MCRRSYDAVFIDFYGTICAGDREVVESTCRNIVACLELSMPPSQFAITWGEQFFQLIEASNHHDFKTLHECEQESLEQTLTSLGVDADPAPFVESLEAYWANPPVYQDAVEFLRKVDKPVCCVSNADSHALYAAIEKHDLKFDAIVSSEEARSYKPDPEIFRQACARLGVEPQSAVHIGDSLHSDVGGAQPLGLTTVWIERESRIHDIGSAQPDLHVTSLNGLHDKLA